MKKLKPLKGVASFGSKHGSSIDSAPPPPKKPKQAPIHRTSRPTRKSQPVELQDVSLDLGENNESLEVEPTRSAPTQQEIKDQVARKEELEKTRYFGVPIRMYNNPNIVLHSTLNDEEMAELHRYGSRIIMNKEGEVVALEVRNDLLPHAKETLAVECCQCTDFDYEVSEGLKTNKRVRRVFMARVLLIETMIRLPVMIFLDAHKNLHALHDFLSHQILLQVFLCIIAQAARVASLRGSGIGRREPCKSVVTLITLVCHTLVASICTTSIQRYTESVHEVQQLEDPPSLAAVNRKLKPISFVHPYLVSYMSGFNMCMNVTFICILYFQSKYFNEMSNLFVTIQLTTGFLLGTIAYPVSVYGILEDARALDAFQFFFGTVFGAGWGMVNVAVLSFTAGGSRENS